MSNQHFFVLMQVVHHDDKIILEKYKQENVSNESTVISDQKDETDAFVKSEANEQLINDKTKTFFKGCGIDFKEENNFIILRKKKFRYKNFIFKP